MTDAQFEKIISLLQTIVFQNSEMKLMHWGEYNISGKDEYILKHFKNIMVAAPEKKHINHDIN